ncbi:MAG: MBL fold metallo-hydrolase [Cytophagales bacterium]|nr:MBL fold metallo-hydrolase [Cytophagales bacterium]MDW8383691.1 MBL fold metallo-hydrolase [Flammeovirgaceae bacterium]
MLIQTFVFNDLYENTYVVVDESTKICCILDPGCYSKKEQNELLRYIEQNHLHVKAIINTHCHVDHVIGNDFCKRTFKAPLFVHENALETLRQVPLYAPLYGFVHYYETYPDEFLKEGELFSVGNLTFQVLDVPGHCEGHLALFHEKTPVVFSGDVLFRNSIGRTDFPGGNFEKIQHSIRRKLYALPDNTIVYAGHGETTTIGFEKIHNPYIRA